MNAWAPCATRATAQARARLYAATRAFFDTRGLLEVDPPLLARAAPPDPHLAALRVHGRFGHRYLPTSPEYGLKRLLAAGYGDLYALGPVFRDEESGRWHLPEFRLLEWYRLGYDDRRLIEEVHEYFAAMLGRRDPLCTIAYDTLFADVFGVDLEEADDEVLRTLCRERGIRLHQGEERTVLLDALMSAQVFPGLGGDGPVFVVDFPPEQAALARLRPGPPPRAARFELFFRGIELANGFWELTEPVEQRRRFADEARRRRRLGLEVPPWDEAFLAALEAGLPDCAGVALGLDRLLALALGFDGLEAVVPFHPWREEGP
ncbi:MAG: EF-P lysine aminoacylase EpmA [Gammaproteobacteria bacterium]|jgi:lysyl-tRNA synthetase class 2|nr:EF-P lysine aminoacylase EpmA [Gammaproteobacteria bacterium]